MNWEDIERLESRINRLLEEHTKVKKAKEAAEKRLHERETEYHQLKGQSRRFEREREEIRERLGKILGHFSRLGLS